MYPHKTSAICKLAPHPHSPIKGADCAKKKTDKGDRGFLVATFGGEPDLCQLSMRSTR